MMTLVFSTMELAAIFASVLIIAILPTLEDVPIKKLQS